MKTDWADYYLFPRVVPSGVACILSILPRGLHAAFQAGEKVRVMVLPMEETREPVLGDDEYPSVVLTAEGPSLDFAWTFPGEQEHLIRIDRYVQGEVDARRRVQLSAYSLLPDLYALRPYRGDLHVHTCHSDGRESPEYVVANYRQKGFDFLAITDHFQWEPSEMAIAAYREIPTGIRLFHGEEIHLEGNHTHIVNFGGDVSVNQLFRSDPEAYQREVRAIERTLTALPPGVDRFEYASNLWAFERIRSGGGMAIFPHPHWIANVYHVRDAMTWALFERRAFDAFELLGGQTKRENNMQCALYCEARARGMEIPIVGSSDSHGTTNAPYFTEEWTLALSGDCTREALMESIRTFHSVAVESRLGEQPFVHGPYRMAKYAMFLLDAYFPQHDELCAIEGGLMHLAIERDAWAVWALADFSPRADEFMRRCFLPPCSPRETESEAHP